MEPDGELKALEGKKVEEWREPVLPWGGKVPIRTRKPGEKFYGVENVPLGNANLTPRTFHNETVEWTREIIDGFGKFTPSAAACFHSIFYRFDSNGDGSLTMDEIQALEFTVGPDSTSPAAEDFLAKFNRTFGKKRKNPAVSSTKPGHITLEKVRSGARSEATKRCEYHVFYSSL